MPPLFPHNDVAQSRLACPTEVVKTISVRYDVVWQAETHLYSLWMALGDYAKAAEYAAIMAAEEQRLGNPA